MRAGGDGLGVVRRKPDWGRPPWKIDFRPSSRGLPTEVDYAIVGAGFTGLAAAAWLRHVAPGKSVAVFEARRIGAGSSGYTGGIALGETAAGDLPGLGDVLAGLPEILRALRVDCEFETGGVYELTHRPNRKDAGARSSPIQWADGGELRVAEEVPGGSVNPGKLVSGLGRAAERLGAMVFEHAGVEKMEYGEPVELMVRGSVVRAEQALVATNAMSLELSGLAERAEPKFTLAVATRPLTAGQLEALGLGRRRPFYTVDLPYLWGRVLARNIVIFGSGLVHLGNWRELEEISIRKGVARELVGRLKERVRRLHPALRDVEFSYTWGGPMLIGEGWRPVLVRHPRTRNVLVLGAYSGHGVALSVYLGRWAAEVMARGRKLPRWNERREPIVWKV